METKISLVQADWKDTDNLIDGFIKAIQNLGGFVYPDPTFEGEDTYSFVVSSKPLTTAEILAQNGCMEDIYIGYKGEAMDMLGYDEEDMEDGSIEDEVNREADKMFEKTYGVSYQEVESCL